MTQSEPLNDVLIADQASKMLQAVETLTKDPYNQMAILKSAASIIQNRIEAAGVKAAMTAALTNVINPQH